METHCKTMKERQAEFMTVCSQFHVKYPADIYEIRHKSDIALWARLINEEKRELQAELVGLAALLTNTVVSFEDLTEQLAKVCAEGVDLVYVTLGLMNTLGLPFDEMFDEIHQANMAKCVDGRVLKDDTGKVLKPDGWQPADKLQVILNAISGA